MSNSSLLLVDDDIGTISTLLSGSPSSYKVMLVRDLGPVDEALSMFDESEGENDVNPRIFSIDIDI